MIAARNRLQELLGFALLTVVTVGLLFSLAPLWHASRVNISTALQETQQNTVGRILAQSRTLVTAKEKQPVLRNRSAERSTHLVA
jgi:hypothetical protein